MTTRQQLIQQARDLGMRGVSHMTKQQLQDLVGKPCHGVNLPWCRSQSRNVLQKLARRCRIPTANKTNYEICRALTVYSSKPVDTLIKDYTSKIINSTTNNSVLVNDNFSKIAQYYRDRPRQYRYNICDMNIDKVIRKLDSGESSAGAYEGYVDLIKSNVAIKIWFDKLNSENGKCLSAEWMVYTFIMPFLFYTHVTPCVLIPYQSGACASQDLSADLRSRFAQHGNKLRYIVAPYIEESLGNYLDSLPGESKYAYSIFFQLTYTISALANVGLRHNDLHLENIRIGSHNKRVFRFAFKLENGKIMYNVTPLMVVIFDFDRMGVDKRWGTTLRNICTRTGSEYCADFNQCETCIDGRRDLLMVTTQMFNDCPGPLREYLMRRILAGSPARLERFRKHMSMAHDKYGDYIDWPKSNYHNFVSIRLSDEGVGRMYPKASDVLHDPEFLRLVLTNKHVFDRVPDDDDKSMYQVYSYQNAFSTAKYNEFSRRFYDVPRELL